MPHLSWDLNSLRRNLTDRRRRRCQVRERGRPRDVIDGEPRRSGYGGGCHPGERFDLAVEVGLVDVAACGRHLGGGVTRREEMGGVVEAHQPGGVLGGEADLGPEAGPQALTAAATSGSSHGRALIRRPRASMAIVNRSSHDAAARSLSSARPASRPQTSSRETTVPLRSVDAPSTATARTGDNRIWRHSIPPAARPPSRRSPGTSPTTMLPHSRRPWAS
jgi:hypothetical protein